MAQKAPRSEDYAGEGDKSELPWGGPKWAPQSKALKLKGLIPIHLRTSLVTHPLFNSLWTAGNHVQAPQPGQGSADGWQHGPLSSSGPSVTPGAAAGPPPAPVLSVLPATSSTFLALEGPDFFHSTLRLSLWNLFCLDSAPLPMSFLLLHFPSLRPHFLSWSFLFAHVCVCAHTRVRVSKRALRLCQSSGGGAPAAKRS